MQPPTAGRIVWYWNEQLVPVAAIVNHHADENGRCSLTVFHPRGLEVVNAPECHCDEPQWGFWSWMPYQRMKADTAEGNQSESAVSFPDSIGDDDEEDVDPNGEGDDPNGDEDYGLDPADDETGEET